MASRKGLAPHVMGYWLKSASMASLAARLMSSGALKSGKPCARFTAFDSIARRVISRITDSVNWEVRSLRNRSRRLAIWTGRTEVFSAEGVIKKRLPPSWRERPLDSGTGSRVHTGLHTNAVPWLTDPIFDPATSRD